MSLFGKSFAAQVAEVVDDLTVKIHGIKELSATVEGKVVTLEGEATTHEAKTALMAEFNKRVETENTFNKIRIQPTAPMSEATQPLDSVMLAASAAAAAAMAAAAAPPAPASEQTYEVKAGDTLSAIAKRFYGSASQYPKIFEANRDVLKDPDHIRPGQKLRIPA